MFPVLFPLLIVGSVILMFLSEFRPAIEEKVIPKIIKLLSVPGETQSTSLITLADSHLEREYLALANQAEKFVWLGFPLVMQKSFTTLLGNIDNSIIMRLIFINKTEAEQIKEIAKKLDQEIEIVHRPRIHFKMLLTEQRLAVGSANFSTNGLEGFHELAILSTEQRMVKEARRYYKSFFEDFGEYSKNERTYSLSSVLPRKTNSVFVNTSNGLNDLVHALLSSAKQSITLVSPYITNDVAEQILNILPSEVQVHFITWVDWRQWVKERSDPEALELFLSNRIKIESCPNLHANCIIVDNQAAIISSQNLTTESWFSRDEAGIYTKNQELIEEILQRIQSWHPKIHFTLQVLEKEIKKFDAFLAKESAPLPKLPDQEEDEVVFPEVAELSSPPLLGFSTLPQTMKTTPKEAIPRKPILPPKAPGEPQWFEDIVYVGKKRLIEYVRACRHQVEKKGSVTIKARGRLIYRAVDVAEQMRMLEELELILAEDSIKIETHYPTAKKTKWGGISQIAITLHQKN